MSVGGLVRALLGESGNSEEFSFRLCALSTRRDAAQRLCAAFMVPSDGVRHVPLPMRLAVPLTDRLKVISAERLFGRASVFHAGPLMVPSARRGAVAVSVYDLTPIRFPQYHLASNRFTLDQIKRRLRRTDAIIVPSMSTAADLQTYDIAPQAKIRVIPLGLNPVFRPLHEKQKGPLQALGLEGKFILAVGSIEPRKNLARLLQAFCLLKKRPGVPHKLAIVGPEGWMQEDVRRSVADQRLSDHVVFTGFVPDEVLNLLYNAAELLVYPSLYEGFGMPPLEAMAAGCPVAVSRVSSLPEVVGDAGVYLDPLDAGDMARAMLQILDSADLRARLVEMGRRRSEEFSWRRNALATLSVYRELCGIGS